MQKDKNKGIIKANGTKISQENNPVIEHRKTYQAKFSSICNWTDDSAAVIKIDKFEQFIAWHSKCLDDL